MDPTVARNAHAESHLRPQVVSRVSSKSAHLSGFSTRHIAPVSIKVEDLHVAVKPDAPFGGNVVDALKRRIGIQHAKTEEAFKYVLVGVSANMPAGSLTAIIGASGSGKTTLLNTIAHRVSGKNLALSGKVSYNGDAKYTSVRGAYVMQQDILVPTLTVRETLEYAADLRLADSTKEERKVGVENVILELGLKDCAETRIGSHLRKGCSGGEKRRTSIGVQMLANPSILCCDEPTTGLDAYSALQVVRTLKKLADRGRTVVMSIHSPRSEIWALLDGVVLLSRGHTLYSGLTADAVDYFRDQGFVKAPLVNPAEFLIDVASIDDRSEDREKVSYDRIQALRCAWQERNSARKPWQSFQGTQLHAVPIRSDVMYEKEKNGIDVWKQPGSYEDVEKNHLSAPLESATLTHAKSFSSFQSTLSRSETGISESSIPWGNISIIRPEASRIPDVESVYSGILTKVGFGRQLMTLTRRSVKITLRDPLGVVGSLFEVLFIATVTGWIFYHLSDDLAGIQSRLGALYNASAFQTFVVLTIEIYRLSEDIKLFDRERSEGVVSVLGFLLSRQLSKMFLENLPVPIIYSIIYYFMSGFRHVAVAFFIFMAVEIFLQYLAITLAMVCVSVSRHLEGATLVGNCAFIIQTFCSGYFIQTDQVAVYMRWLKWTSFAFYAFGALVNNQFLGVDQGPYGRLFPCPYSDDPADPRCRAYTGLYVVENLGFPDNWLWRPIVVVISFPVAFFFLAALLLTFWRVDIVVTGTQKKSPEETSKEIEMMPYSREKVGRIEVGLHQYGVDLHQRHLLHGKSHKVIIHPVTTTFESGCINAILGPSGSGKTTLLQSLADRLRGGFLHKYHVAGNITLNRNIPSTTSVLRAITSFVTQDDDALMPSLTVRETLQFAAGLRLPSRMSKADKRRRVEEVILKMGLKNCADRLVGNDLKKGISGGEKRRVSIATQILTDPKVLLLDEPTSGLDTFTANSVMDVLRTLAEEGRTILLTIHQPRSDLFKSFKNVLVLARGGHVVYSGPGKDILPYFSRSFGLNCPLDTSPADFVLDNVAIDLQEQGLEDISRQKVEKIIRKWQEVAKPKLNRQESGIATEAELNSYKREMNPFRTTFPIVMHRSALNMWRNVNLVIARNGQTIGLAVIYTLFFAPLQDNQEAIQSRIGFIQQVTSLYFVGMLQNLSVYPTERDLFLREHADNCYTPLTFLLSYTALEFPFTAASSLVFGLLAAYASNLGRSFPVTLVAALDVCCLVSCGESLGIVFCSLLEAHTGFALTMTSTCIAISATMAGVLSLRLPDVLKAVNWLSPSKYAVASLAAYALKGRVFTCSEAQEVEGVCPLQTGEQVLQLYGFDSVGWPYLVGLVGITVAYRVVAYVVLVLKMR